MIFIVNNEVIDIVKESTNSYIANCPFCHKITKFYIYKNGAPNYICFVCGKIGTAKKQTSELGEILDNSIDSYAPLQLADIDYELLHQILMSNVSPESRAAKLWLQKRLITDEIIVRLRLGFDPWQNAISIPVFKQGQLVGVKFRRLSGTKPKYVGVVGSNFSIYNSDAIEGETYAIISEGELDTVSILSNSDFRSVCAIGGASIQPDIELFAGVNKIYICADQDEVGERAASRWAEILGADRCYRVKWDKTCKDITDFFVKNNFKTVTDRSKLFAGLLADAKPYAKPLIKEAKEFNKKTLEFITQPKNVLQGVSTGIQELDRFMGGFREKEVTLLTGDTSSGKSTFSVWMLYKQLKAGHSCLLGSFEMPIEIMQTKILSMHHRYNFSKYGANKHTIKPDFKIMDKLFFIDRLGTISLSDLKRAIYDAFLRYHVRFIVLDHLHKFIEVSDSETEWQALGNAVRKIVEWIKELPNVHLVLIVQFTKRAFDTEISKELIKGSSNIQQDADNIIVLVREREYKTRVKIEKTRSDAAEGGPDARFYLIYSPKTCEYMSYKTMEHDHADSDDDLV